MSGFEGADPVTPSHRDTTNRSGSADVSWEAVSFSSVLLYTLVVIPWPTLFALYLLGVNLFVTQVCMQQLAVISRGYTTNEVINNAAKGRAHYAYAKQQTNDDFCARMQNVLAFLTAP